MNKGFIQSDSVYSTIAVRIERNALPHVKKKMRNNFTSIVDYYIEGKPYLVWIMYESIDTSNYKFSRFTMRLIFAGVYVCELWHAVLLKGLCFR